MSDFSDHQSIRINELCRELGIKAKVVIEYLPQIGITEKKTYSSSISNQAAQKIRQHFRGAAQLDVTSKPASEADASVQSTTEQLDDGPPEVSFSQAAEPKGLVLHLPRSFTFRRGFADFDFILSHFDWTLKRVPVLVDLTGCELASFQMLVLLIQYLWHLRINGCQVTFKYGTPTSGPTKMLKRMAALEWSEVLVTDGKNFGSRPGQTHALRRRSDVQNVVNVARRAIQDYAVGFPNYLSYIVSELLYNATEHGSRQAVVDNCNIIVPAIFQFGRYPASEKLSFFFSDLGIGIKAHLERAYPPFPTDQEAIAYALRPNVSGTFRHNRSPYGAENNAGMGLAYSSLMSKRLRGDMYIVSHNGLAHISPEDVTTRRLRHSWPGTFVLVDLDISNAPNVSLEDLLAEIRGQAEDEVEQIEKNQQAVKFYVSIENHFGKWAEDKDAAINFRDHRLLPAVATDKQIELDFRGVETAPHSFLNALLATAVRQLGVKAYQQIRVYNATGPIHEIIQTIFEHNVPKLK